MERDDGAVVASTVEVGESLWRRFMGLMGRPGLPEGHGLLLRPSSSIHMFFMRFPIDAAFLDREGRVLRVYAGLKPWRISSVVRHAKAVVELPAGTLAAAGVGAGDTVRFVDAAQDPPGGGEHG